MSIATHDTRLVEIVQALAARHRCEPGAVEYAFSLGRCLRLQQRLVQSGEAVRVIVPYGPQWLDGVESAVRGALNRSASALPTLRSVRPG